MIKIDFDELTRSHNLLVQIYEICRKVVPSDCKLLGSSRKVVTATQILNKSLVHIHSINTLLKVGKQNIYDVDISLIASAARNIMECGNLYFHLTARGLSKDQYELRDNVLSLHHLSNEVDMFNKFNFDPNSTGVKLRHFAIDITKDSIRNSPLFQAMDANAQNQLLSGKKAAFMMRSPNIFSAYVESAIYNLFSNSVHGYSVGLGNFSVNESPAFLSVFDWTVLMSFAIIVSRIYVSNMIADYLHLCTRLHKKLSKDEISFIKTCKDQADLNHTIDLLKDSTKLLE